MTIHNVSVSKKCSSCLTDLEIDQGLSSKLQKIREQINLRLNWKNFIFPVTKNLLGNVVKEPVQASFKVVFCAGAGYIIYLLTRGTFAGIAVDNDSDFSNIFSSDKDVRLQEGLNMTNGDQAGQFIRDGLITGYVTFYLLFRQPYNEYAGKVINDSYKPYLEKLLTKIHQMKSKYQEGDKKIEEQLINKLKKIKRLYKRLIEDLKPYNSEPIFYKKIVITPLNEDKNFEQETEAS